MTNQVSTINSISFLLIISLSLIPSIQSLSCDSSCYDITLSGPTQSNNAWCYQYTTTFTPVSSTCTSNIGTPKLLFGINPSQCYLSEQDFESIIESTIPWTKTIYHDDSNPINPIGIEFEVDPNNPITICLYGTNQQTITSPIRISDDQTQCDSNFDQSPDICGICNGDKAETSCFCNDNESDCLSSARPRGDLICSWDSTNNRCSAITASFCELPITDNTPCACFWDESQCQESNDECSWDSPRNLCARRECIGDNLSCPCIEIQQDCENEIVDFPSVCLWDVDECKEFESTNPTEIPTSQPTIGPTICRDRCSCFNNIGECNAETIDHPLDCVWTDICVEMTTTGTPETSVSTESTETTDSTETTESTLDTTETSRIWTRRPTESPTPKVWSKKPTTVWNKPTPRSSGWGGNGKGKGKGKGKKGGKP